MTLASLINWLFVVGLMAFLVAAVALDLRERNLRRRLWEQHRRQSLLSPPETAGAPRHEAISETPDPDPSRAPCPCGGTLLRQGRAWLCPRCGRDFWQD